MRCPPVMPWVFCETNTVDSLVTDLLATDKFQKNGKGRDHFVGGIPPRRPKAAARKIDACVSDWGRPLNKRKKGGRPATMAEAHLLRQPKGKQSYRVAVLHDLVAELLEQPKPGKVF